MFLFRSAFRNLVEPLGALGQLPDRARRRVRATMAPLAGSEKAAIENFFASKRGQRVLLPSSRDKLALYHVDKSVTLPELPVARPPDPAQLEDWVEVEAAIAAHG